MKGKGKIFSKNHSAVGLGIILKEEEAIEGLG
jgi:hypothetical protein